MIWYCHFLAFFFFCVLLDRWTILFVKYYIWAIFSTSFIRVKTSNYNLIFHLCGFSHSFARTAYTLLLFVLIVSFVMSFDNRIKGNEKTMTAATATTKLSGKLLHRRSSVECVYARCERRKKNKSKARNRLLLPLLLCMFFVVVVGRKTNEASDWLCQTKIYLNCIQTVAIAQKKSTKRYMKNIKKGQEKKIWNYNKCELWSAYHKDDEHSNDCRIAWTASMNKKNATKKNYKAIKTASEKCMYGEETEKK